MRDVEWIRRYLERRFASEPTLPYRIIAMGVIYVLMAGYCLAVGILGITGHLVFQ